LLQQLFPTEGETQPKFRFPEFKDDGDWEETVLENCLDYLQPTGYLVSSTEYDDKYETPVLTAGKTFILGYTDEKEGIFYENLPVIIFDDFTTASKFVDFAFKAKSSAMKILLAKNDNDIKFMFEAIQNLKFEVSTHKRHWISVYSKLNILKPRDPKEQQKIAACLSAVDELLEAQEKKIEQLQEHKKGLLQQLFPTINELAI
jgi:type I restriction enzyme S subunit